MFLSSSTESGAVRRVSFLMNTWVGARLVSGSGMDETFRSLKDTEETLSRFLPDSDISLANREAAHRPVRLSSAVFGLLKESLAISRITGGAFDITMAPLVDLWRRAESEKRMPSADEVSGALEVTGCQHLRLDESRQEVSFAKKGMRLDLGAIGKGYALDAAAAVLREKGVREAMLDAGGNILCLDPEGCRVAIRHPLHEQETVAELILRDEAVATSANDQRFLNIGGQRFSHLLDPRDGRPVEGDILSVSVVASRAALADALSTALFVTGPERGLDAAKGLGASKAVVVRKKAWGRIRVEEFIL